MSLLNLQDFLPGNSEDPLGKNLFDFVDDRKKNLSNLVGNGFKTVDRLIDQNIPGGEQFTDNWSAGINRSINGINGKINGTTEALKRKTQEPIDSIDDIGPWLLGSFINGSEAFTNGAKTVTKAAGIDPRAGELLGSAATEVALFGAGKVAKGVSKLPPPKTPKFAVATQSSRPGLLQLSPQKQDSVFNIATNMQPANWSAGVKSLCGDKKAIRRFLSKPYHQPLKGSRFEYISLDELVNNKGGWLETLMERDSKFAADHAKYMKSKSGVKQRKMYDQYTDNPLSTAKQVYDDNILRKALTKSFNEITGKEWHHVFGNKDAAELMLTKIAQDPYISVNLFHHMQRLKLPISGKADNIALMSKTLHRKKGGLHSYQKKLGIENTGRKKGILELNDMAAEISKAVLENKTDVTELFTLIEKYAQLNKQHLRPKIKNEFGGKMLDELKGVEAFIQGQ